MLDTVIDIVFQAAVVFSIALSVPIGVACIFYYFKKYSSSFLLFLGIYYIINAPRPLLNLLFWISNNSVEIKKFYIYFVLFQKRLQIFSMLFLSLNQFFHIFFSTQKFDYSFWTYFCLISSAVLCGTYSMMDYVLSKGTKDIPEILILLSFLISFLTIIKAIFHYRFHPNEADFEDKKLIAVIFVISTLSSIRLFMAKNFPTISYFDCIFEFLTLLWSIIVLCIVCQPIRRIIFCQTDSTQTLMPIMTTVASKRLSKPFGQMMQMIPKNHSE